MLRRLLHWLFDRGEPIQYGPLDEEPPPIRNWGDGIAKVRELHPNRPRPMDEPRPRDDGGMSWDDE